MSSINCRVLKRHGLKVDVEYDNGERETVLAENVSPLDVPVAFGSETVPLQVRAADARSVCSHTRRIRVVCMHLSPMSWSVTCCTAWVCGWRIQWFSSVSCKRAYANLSMSEVQSGYWAIWRYRREWPNLPTRGVGVLC